jgi:excinuclease ABC subunit B
VARFNLKSDFKPTGDQPQAIEKLVRGLTDGYDFQTLLGVTGSGKTFTMANVIQEVQRPTLVIAHNKTWLLSSAPSSASSSPITPSSTSSATTTTISPRPTSPRPTPTSKRTPSINDEIDRLRHSATQAVLERRDVIVVASVSCIYGIGSKEDYGQTVLLLKVGDTYDREKILRRLIDMQFTRNDIALGGAPSECAATCWKYSPWTRK